MKIALEGTAKKLSKEKKFANYKVGQATNNRPEGWMKRELRKILSEEAEKLWAEE